MRSTDTSSSARKPESPKSPSALELLKWSALMLLVSVGVALIAIPLLEWLEL